jgi:tetratricopeptide (TPR) repeat protein
VLVEREVVERRGDSRFPGERELLFRHALLREAAYAMLTDSDRRLGHGIAAEWLTSAGESDALLLAEHLERGGRSQDAVPWYRRAAEQALDANDLAGMIDRAERGIAAGATGQLLGELRVMQAEARRWRGEHQLAGQCAEEALELIDRGATAWFRAMMEAIGAAARLGKRTRTAELAVLAFDASRGIDLGVGHVLMLARAAQSLQTGDQPELAVPLLELMSTAPPDILAQPAVAGRVLQARAQRMQVVGDVAGSVGVRRAALEAFVAAGDERNAVMARHNLGYIQMRLGLFEEAERELYASLDAAEKLGLPYSAAGARSNLALVIALRGRIDEALRDQAAAVETLRAHGDRRMEGGGRVHIAMILVMAGRLEEAEQEARKAIEVLPAGASLGPYARATLAHVLLARGRVGEALASAREAWHLLEKRGGTAEDGDALVRLVLAEALEAAGEHAAAREVLSTAAARIRTFAQGIADERVRESFLRSVPEHARTLELAAGWGI